MQKYISFIFLDLEQSRGVLGEEKDFNDYLMVCISAKVDSIYRMPQGHLDLPF